jgi:hypothetical protein
MLCQSRCYLTFFHFPNVVTSKWLVHQGLKLIRTCPTLTSVTPGSTFLYTLMDFFCANCGQAVAILPSSIFRTFNCTSKTLVPQKELELIEPAHANKVLLKVHSYIHWWTSFSRTKLWPSRCYLTFFHFPERSIALVKWLVRQRAELIEPPAPR